MKLGDFLEVANKTKLAQRSKDAARLVLVEGMRAIDVARQLDMKRQHVQESVQRIEAAYLRAHGVPDGWECMTVCVPAEKAGDVREIELQARRDAGLSMD
jgi:hypothetical protein